MMLAAGAIGVVGTSALAVDQPVPGQRLVVRATSTRARLAFSAADPGLVVPAPGGADDPLTVGASLEIVNPGSGESAIFAMPASGWTLNSAGTAFKFVNTSAPAPPSAVRLARMRNGRSADTLRVRAKSAGITLDEPSQGSLQIILTVGAQRYCTLFGGVVADVPGRFVARRAPAPASCPGGTTSTTGATTTSTTVSSTSTSTTTETTSTTTTLPPTDCPRLRFTTGTPGGVCGRINDAADGTGADLDPFPEGGGSFLECGTLYVGGGGSVQPPSPTPDGSTAIFDVEDCVAQTAMALAPATSTVTGSDRTCTAANCFFGPPLPIPNASSPAVSTCIINRIASSPAVGGVLDATTGEASVTLPLRVSVFVTGDLESASGVQPCPTCTAGTCDSGPSSGGTCVTPTSLLTSHDCPPPGTPLAPFGVNLSPLRTGQVVTSAADGNLCGVGQRTPGAFGAGTARYAEENGSPSGDLRGGASLAAIQASVFCIPKSGSALVDSVANLPGPGAVTLAGRAQLLGVAGTTTTTNSTTTSTTSIPTTITTVPTTSTTSTTLPPGCPPPALPLGSLEFTIAPGAASCGGVGRVPPPVGPFSDGEIRNGSGQKISDLGLGCLYLGGGEAVIPGSRLPDGSTSLLDVSNVAGLGLSLAASNGTGPNDCTRGAGPGRHCSNGNPGLDGMGLCTSDAHCGGPGTCNPDANCMFGPPVPVPSPDESLSTCILNVIAGDPCGTADLLAGSTTLSVFLSARLYLTGNAASPCPQCVGGLCTAGQRAGLPCAGGIGSANTTRECPPLNSQFLAALPVGLALSTGTSVATDASGEFCANQRTPGAFGLSAARAIEQVGAPLGVPALSTTLVGNFCVQGTGIPLIDTVVDLPGPGTVSVPGTASVCLPPLCL
jgi:hypothetical protein